MAGMCMLAVIVVSLACWIQVVIGSCSRGTFGDSCSYTCHCGQSCHQTTGVCGGVCDRGWVGGQGKICQKENVALGKDASSPTRLWTSAWSADKAVDGNSHQNVYKNSCFHSKDNVQSSWRVDLGDDYRIHDVRIYHQKNHLARIRTAALYMSNTNNTPSVPCYTFPSNTSDTGSGIYNVVCDGIGRYFTITDPTHLNLCEVEIYVCSPGVFGDSCNQFCHCLQATCDPVSGVCPGECRPGWQGNRCDTECDADYYGVNCMDICTNRKCSDVNSSCDRYNGSCDKECLPGWRGVDCTQECNNGTYGANCNMTCSERKCAGDSSCDHVRGTCTSGCVSGWKGEDCTTACDSQHYGAKCDKTCASRHCVGNSSCNSTGDCDRGCETGWTLDDCTACIPGYFGTECKEECGLCAGNHKCHSSSGKCPSGCVEEYMGPQCKDQSEPTQTVPVAALAGTAVGVVLVALVVILLVLLRRRRRQKGKGSSSNESVLKETSHVPSKRTNVQDAESTYINVGFDEEAKPVLSSKKTRTTTAQVALASPSPDGRNVNMRENQSGDKRDNVLVNHPVDSQGVPVLEDEEDYDTNAQVTPQEAPDLADRSYYNLDDVEACHAIPVSSLATRVQAMEDQPERAEEEFKRLPDGFMHSYEESQKTKNKGKNRFKGYYPYDFNRVILHDASDDSRSDYINASYLDGYKSEKRYIAAQGPYKSDIITDFWKMIWQEGCSTIVMVTGLVEACKMKCLQYWPEKGTNTFGVISVTLAAQTQLANYTITKLAVQKEKESMRRIVHHLHFTSWPDHGVPDTAALLEFLWRVKVISGQQTQPIIVHCSAGIGRTGTYITIDSLVEQAKTEGIVDVVSFVSNMRGQRKNMIQTKEQYLFIYQALARAVSDGDTTLDSTFIKHLDLGQVLDVTVGNRTVQQHLEAFQRGSGGHAEGAVVTSVPSYASRNGFFIMSSHPEKEAVWNQVYNSDSHILITNAGGALDYLPSVDCPVTTTRFEVSMSRSTALSDDILLNTVELKLKDIDDSTVLQHYHIMGSVRDPSFHLLIDNFLTWTSDPQRGLSTVVAESVEEFRLLVLLLNIASRLQDDGRVDVINNMRQLYTRLGGPPFTETDVRFCLDFTQQWMKKLGVYANF
ncbi:uncharacterized protein [Haliotis cracherodii]|uniref:uncharacterized protein n=1 Tax=Haliotis cracherodii TaxID=6455 RepID=UPI0039ED5873